MAEYMDTLTAKEADALYDAAEYARKNRGHTVGEEELGNLARAIRKLRRATMLVIQPAED